ncbi:hypothetical protein SKPI104516_11870 [Skermania piniformis]
MVDLLNSIDIAARTTTINSGIPPKISIVWRMLTYQTVMHPGR